MSPIEKFKSSIIVKLMIIGALVLILLIPTAMISELINEREARRNEAVTEAGSKWGNPQTLAGPFLKIPYKVITEIEKGKFNEEIKNAYFLPQELKISGDVSPYVLRRGIYEIVAYQSNLDFKGKFNAPDFKIMNINEANVLWDRAEVMFGISDLRGVNTNLAIKWNEKDFGLKPGALSGLTAVPDIARIKTDFKAETVASVTGSGVNARIPIEAGKTYSYSINLDINGSDKLTFIPLGNETNVQLNSNWKNPSFDGAFLPDEREVGAEGFKANWNILQLNRNIPDAWTGEAGVNAAAFGVKLLMPVDGYQKNMRSIKYSILLIALTFLVFFLIEVMNKLRIHPIQYLLTGFALVLFYSLLLAIAEHLNFNLAYLISAGSIIILVILYSKTIFKSIKLALLQGGFLAVIYTFIFVLLQLQDYTLLIGSIGLFIVLAAVMYISRNIDWYSFMGNEVK